METTEDKINKENSTEDKKETEKEKDDSKDSNSLFSPKISHGAVRSFSRHSRAVVNDVQDSMLEDNFNPHRIANSKDIFEQGLRFIATTYEGFIHGLKTRLIKRPTLPPKKKEEENQKLLEGPENKDRLTDQRPKILLGGPNNSFENSELHIAAPLLKLEHKANLDKPSTDQKRIHVEKRLLLNSPEFYQKQKGQTNIINEAKNFVEEDVQKNNNTKRKINKNNNISFEM